MSMLREFFDIKSDTRKLFNGLTISENTRLCDEWMNKYPVVFITLKSVEGLNFKAAIDEFSMMMRGVLTKFDYLLSST